MGPAVVTAGDTGWEFDPGSRIKGAQPSLFSASISYDYPFDVPPGRGGLTPALGLSYSSARHQRETGHYSFVGHGWDILGESYMAKADPIHPAGSKLTLVLNGATYTVSTMPFFVQEESPYPNLGIPTAQRLVSLLSVQGSHARWHNLRVQGLRCRFKRQPIAARR